MSILPSQSTHASAVYDDMMAQSSTIEADGHMEFYPHAIGTDIEVEQDYLFIGAVAIAGLIDLDGSVPDVSDVFESAQSHREIDILSTADQVQSDCKTMLEFAQIEGCEQIADEARRDFSHGLYDILVAALIAQMSHERAQYSALRARVGD